ncbi:MAG: glycosyltransferase family 4 protein, partial [Promethearchaeota archaeon]
GMERNVFKEYNNIITISNRSKNSLKNVYNVEDKNIKVFPIGIDDKKFNPSNRSEQIREKYGNNILLYSGLMLPRKRVPVLLEAMTNVIKEIPDVHLILTGKGRLLNDYKKLAKTLGIQNNTSFLGFVEDNELLKFYASCDIFVFPSWREGFGQAILEAMASGTPVICADMPPMSEIVGNGGLTFKQDDSKDLAKKIIQLLNNRDELARLRENALTKVKEYSWIQIAKGYYDYLRLMINYPKNRS